MLFCVVMQVEQLGSCVTVDRRGTVEWPESEAVDMAPIIENMCCWFIYLFWFQLSLLRRRGQPFWHVCLTAVRSQGKVFSGFVLKRSAQELLTPTTSSWQFSACSQKSLLSLLASCAFLKTKPSTTCRPWFHPWATCPLLGWYFNLFVVSCAHNPLTEAEGAVERFKNKTKPVLQTSLHAKLARPQNVAHSPPYKSKTETHADGQCLPSAEGDAGLAPSNK